MAEVGLVRFGRLALEVSQAVLPAQRTKFSKRQFTQPQLLVVLCLMHYEDWTIREAEVRLSEHTELRSALRLNSVPDYTTLYRFLARLDPVDVARVAYSIQCRLIRAIAIGVGMEHGFQQRLQDHLRHCLRHAIGDRGYSQWT
jgi:hypothetical protein